MTPHLVTRFLPLVTPATIGGIMRNVDTCDIVTMGYVTIVNIVMILLVNKGISNTCNFEILYVECTNTQLYSHMLNSYAERK